MLAFDDAALARILIAATAMPSNARGPWLERVAERLENQSPLAGCSSRAEKQRAYRRRKRAKLIRPRLTIDRRLVAKALRREGVDIGDDPEGDPKAIAVELKQAFRCLAAVLRTPRFMTSGARLTPSVTAGPNFSATSTELHPGEGFDSGREG